MPSMRQRIALVLLALPCFALAEIASFEDVEFHDKNIESGKVKDRDGMFHLDRDTGIFAFTADNRLWVTIPGNRVTGVTYEEKKDRNLVIRYTDARGRAREASFKLKGGNRENILSVINSETDNKLVRIGK